MVPPTGKTDAKLSRNAKISQKVVRAVWCGQNVICQTKISLLSGKEYMNCIAHAAISSSAMHSQKKARRFWRSKMQKVSEKIVDGPKFSTMVCPLPGDAVAQ